MSVIGGEKKEAVPIHLIESFDEVCQILGKYITSSWDIYFTTIAKTQRIMTSVSFQWYRNVEI